MITANLLNILKYEISFNIVNFLYYTVIKSYIIRTYFDIKYRYNKLK